MEALVGLSAGTVKLRDGLLTDLPPPLSIATF